MFSQLFNRSPLYQPFTSSFAPVAKAGINWSGILSGTQKTLNIINQAIPVFYQVKPIWNNAKTVFRVIGEMGKLNNNNRSSTSNENTNTTTVNDQTNEEVVQSKEEVVQTNRTVAQPKEEIVQTNETRVQNYGPKFFV